MLRRNGAKWGQFSPLSWLDSGPKSCTAIFNHNASRSNICKIQRIASPRPSRVSHGHGDSCGCCHGRRSIPSPRVYIFMSSSYIYRLFNVNKKKWRPKGHLFGLPRPRRRCQVLPAGVPRPVAAFSGRGRIQQTLSSLPVKPIRFYYRLNCQRRHAATFELV